MPDQSAIDISEPTTDVVTTVLRRLRGEKFAETLSYHLAATLEPLLANDERFFDESRPTPPYLSPMEQPLLRKAEKALYLNAYEVKKRGIANRNGAVPPDSWTKIDRETAIKALVPWLTRLIDERCEASASGSDANNTRLLASVAAGMLIHVDAFPELLPEQPVDAAFAAAKEVLQRGSFSLTECR